MWLGRCGWHGRKGDSDQPSQRYCAFLQFVEHAENCAHRIEEAVEEQGCGGGGADADLTVLHQPEACDQHGGEADELRDVEPAEEPGA